MDKKRKYRITKASDFYDYSEGRLSAEDRNAFERQLQRDPFEEEAAEGLSMVSRSKAETDLKTVSGKIRSRRNRRNRIAWYSIAAAVASILVVTTIFTNIGDSGLEKQSTAPEFSEFTYEQPASPPMEITETEKTRELQQAEKPVPQQAESIAETEIYFEESESNDQGISAGNRITENEAVKSETSKAFQASMAEMEEIAAQQVLNYDAENYPGDQMEDMVIQQKSSRTAEKKMAPAAARSYETIKNAETLSPEYTTATPVLGDSGYAAYIDSVMIYPTEATVPDEVVVEVSFIITPEGRPANFKVVSSPSKDFSDEAIRIINSGPDWKPAMKDGEYIEEKISFNVVFRK